MEAIRESNCNDCPFKRGVPWAAMEIGSMPVPFMLCHESSCLEGSLDYDVICAGLNIVRE